MDPNAPSPESEHCDDVLSLKKQLALTEDKLLKFKKFVVNLRNERSQLQEKITESTSEVERLKSELGKYQSKSYQQIFQNFQSLQNEYDKIQDELDVCKKSNKTLENDLLKCTENFNISRQTVANQDEQIVSLKGQLAQQQQQLDNIVSVNKDLESKIIVLQAECKQEKKKNSDLKICANERNVLNEELSLRNSQLTELTARLQELEESIVEYRKQLSDKEHRLAELEHSNEVKTKLEEDIRVANETNASLSQSKQELEFNNNELENRIAKLQLEHSQRVTALELTISELRTKLEQCEQDLALTNGKFDEYKCKVSNVLKEDKLSSYQYSTQIEELNVKLESLQERNDSLSMHNNELEGQLKQIVAEKDELHSKFTSCENQLKNYTKIESRIQQLNNENRKLNHDIEQQKSFFAKEKHSLVKKHEMELDNVRAKYESKLKELEDEIVRISSEDSNSTGNSNTSFEEIKEEQLSFQSTNSSSERNFLEEILNVDMNKSLDAPTVSNIDNLTQLLSESENSISLLSEQNRLLKEEIRRLQRSVERMDIADNLEYLKNVLLKFLTIKGVDERERLITVLTTILKLTPEERTVFHECSNLPSNPNGTNSKWNLWQWS